MPKLNKQILGVSQPKQAEVSLARPFQFQYPRIDLRSGHSFDPLKQIDIDSNGNIKPEGTIEFNHIYSSGRTSPGAAIFGQKSSQSLFLPFFFVSVPPQFLLLTFIIHPQARTSTTTTLDTPSIQLNNLLTLTPSFSPQVIAWRNCISPEPSIHVNYLLLGRSWYFIIVSS